MTRLWPSLLGMAQVVQPETILRWHRVGFTAFWRWKSRNRTGRPKIDRELRDLIRQMNKENRLWGAPRIHGELLKLGFERRGVDRLHLHGQTPRTAIADMADIPAQPCGRDCGDRTLPGSDRDV